VPKGLDDFLKFELLPDGAVKMTRTVVSKGKIETTVMIKKQ